MGPPDVDVESQLEVFRKLARSLQNETPENLQKLLDKPPKKRGSQKARDPIKSRQPVRILTKEEIVKLEAQGLLRELRLRVCCQCGQVTHAVRYICLPCADQVVRADNGGARHEKFQHLLDAGRFEPHSH